MKEMGHRGGVMETRIGQLLLAPEATLREALEAMERPPKEDHPVGIVLVVDPSRRLLGVVTDGDVRRALLAQLPLDARLSAIMTRDPVVVREDEVAVGSYASVFRNTHFRRRLAGAVGGRIVVVDAEHRPVGVVDLLDLLRRQTARTQTICIVGMGYVGLTLAVAMAEAGLTVHGVEANATVRERLLRGDVHFHEIGLERAFRAHLGERLFVGERVGEPVADVYVVSVGTPVDAKGKPILRDVEAAARAVGKILKGGDLVALRSTVPIGACRSVVVPILEAESNLKAGRDFDLVFAPERTVAGNALHELRTLPQVVGSLSRGGLERATALFREITPSVIAAESLEAAEAVKLVNNAYRDHIFAFANEVALVCEGWGLDSAHVIRAANEGYPRHQIPGASPGVGGTCLRKDPYLLLESARAVGYEPKLLGRSRSVNESMTQHIHERVLAYFDESGIAPADATVFVAGFAFKGEPETSDLRDSPTLDLVARLAPVVGAVRGFDPIVSESDLASVHGVKSCQVAEGVAGANVIIAMTNHRSFRQWPLPDLLATTRRPTLVVDPWRLFEPSEVCREPGIRYDGLSGTYERDVVTGKARLLRPREA